MLKLKKFWKKSVSKPTLDSGVGRGSVGEKNYEIFVFVPFVLSEIAVYWNLVNNPFQHNSKYLYTFIPNKLL